jgi:sulfide:quinone oxidoreductase
LDAFDGGRIVIGIAGMPYKCPPAPLEVAFLIESELRERGLRENSDLHFCSPIGRAFTIETVSEMATPILESRGIELHTFFNVEAIDPIRKVVQSLEGEELPYDLLILVPPHKGAQFLIDSGLAPAPGGWLPTNRATLQVGGRQEVFALGDATDLPLSKAGSTAHFEAPVVVERIVAAVEGRQVDPRRGDYLGKVMCFFEIGDGKGTVLQFDYEHPPKPPKPNQLWHLGKIVFNKTYWHTVPKGRV